MIASILHLSRQDCQNIRKNSNGVFDTYTVHKIVYSLFPIEAQREGRDFLFADKGGDFHEKRILLLSKEMPQRPQYGTIESKPIPDAFLAQQFYGFEVQLNPVKRDSKSGKIIPIRGKEELCTWFIQKAPSFGFEVLENSLSVGDTDVLRFEKGGKELVLGKAVFTGKLKVLDRNLFLASFEKGLGKGKAFGFGLIQIVPLAAASVDA